MAKTTMTREERAKRRRKMAKEVRKTNDLTAVAREFKVSPATVRLACWQHAVPLPKAYKRRSFKCSTVKVIVDLIEGKTQADIARKFKITRQRVSAIKQQAIKAEIMKR